MAYAYRHWICRGEAATKPALQWGRGTQLGPAKQGLNQSACGKAQAKEKMVARLWDCLCPHSFSPLLPLLPPSNTHRLRQPSPRALLFVTAVPVSLFLSTGFPSHRVARPLCQLLTRPHRVTGPTAVIASLLSLSWKCVANRIPISLSLSPTTRSRLFIEPKPVRCTALRRL